MQIIHVNLTQESPKPLEVGRTVDMTYSVKWISTNVTFARRFDVYLDYPFFEHQVKHIDVLFLLSTVCRSFDVLLLAEDDWLYFLNSFCVSIPVCFLFPNFL